MGKDRVHFRLLSTGFEAGEIATLEWAEWFNTRRLLEPIGHPREPVARPEAGLGNHDLSEAMLRALGFYSDPLGIPHLVE